MKFINCLLAGVLMSGVSVSGHALERSAALPYGFVPASQAAASEGSSIPSKAIMAFASSTCPTGWSVYGPAAGRFLRGVDAAHPLGSTQSSQSNRVVEWMERGNTQVGGVGGYFGDGSIPESGWSGFIGNGKGGGGSVLRFRTAGVETYPNNVAVLYCVKD